MNVIGKVRFRSAENQRKFVDTFYSLYSFAALIIKDGNAVFEINKVCRMETNGSGAWRQRNGQAVRAAGV